MKKTKILVSLSLCGAVLALGSMNALAQDKAETNGVITFTDDGKGGEIHKPEIPTMPIDPEGGGSAELGNLYLKHVPDFNFGVLDYKVGADSKDAIFETYKEKTTGATSKGIPHFLQVYDGGSKTGSWLVTVSASQFEAPGKEPLPNATIVLKEGKLSNDIFGVAGEAGETISQKVGTGISASGVTIPTTSSLKLIGAKSGQSTRGSNTSLVFSKDYDKDADYPVTMTNPGVAFNKTVKDIPEVNTMYTSVVTWTISDGLMP